MLFLMSLLVFVILFDLGQFKFGTFLVLLVDIFMMDRSKLINKAKMHVQTLMQGVNVPLGQFDLT